MWAEKPDQVLATSTYVENKTDHYIKGFEQLAVSSIIDDLLYKGHALRRKTMLCHKCS